MIRCKMITTLPLEDARASLFAQIVAKSPTRITTRSYRDVRPTTLLFSIMQERSQRNGMVYVMVWSVQTYFLSRSGKGYIQYRGSFMMRSDPGIGSCYSSSHMVSFSLQCAVVCCLPPRAHPPAVPPQPSDSNPGPCRSNSFPTSKPRPPGLLIDIDAELRR